ncbi:7970_t:CDS:2 [Dentiscutata erythropus]|uniref:7970_t:CDS:1 n=1 Tax=Dentiscutata erythropus TaxID=1348616 RepID=A0A9N8ZN24_9GLOM|nr:7970_t:CDS:2 [Dentiscutata erythropus]
MTPMTISTTLVQKSNEILKAKTPKTEITMTQKSYKRQNKSYDDSNAIVQKSNKTPKAKTPKTEITMTQKSYKRKNESCDSSNDDSPKEQQNTES